MAGEILETTVVRIGGADWTASPMCLTAARRFISKLRRIRDRVALPDAQMEEEDIDAIADLAFAVLKPNHPDLTLEQVSDMMTIRDVPRIFPLLLAAAGFEKSPAGEAAGSERSTGENSTG